jgi:hypothetical protein
MITKVTMYQRNNNENKPNPTPVFEEVLSRLVRQNLSNRIVGEPPVFRGKPRFYKKDTVKRRKEKKRVLVMMRSANLRENRAMVNVWDQE